MSELETKKMKADETPKEVEEKDKGKPQGEVFDKSFKDKKEVKK